MSSIWPALRTRRFLLSAWPWRSLLYVVTTVIVATPVALFAWILAIPWLATLNALRDGRVPDARNYLLMAVSLVIIAMTGPLVAVPLAAIERRRLALVDTREVRTAHRPVRGGDPIAWIRTRYAEAATWLEVLYGLLFTLVVPVVYGFLFLLAGIELALLSAPLLAGFGSSAVQLANITIDTPGESAIAALTALALIPPLVYLFSGVTAAQAAAARALLGSDRAAGALREVARSRARLVDAFEAERRRIQRDLHDGAQHQLTSLTLQLGMARLDLPAGSPAAEPLNRAHEQAKDLMVMLRDLVHGIRPQVLGDLGLMPAIRELADRTPLPVMVIGPDVVTRPPEHVETTAWFVASEALGNVTKHAAARHAEVRVIWDGENLVLEVRDDGAGGADPAAGSGLTGLADRVAAAGGRLLLASPAGSGTLVRVELPCR
ncbi:sensor domain-containing protein [Actinoplanes sp. NPDC049265]|uniref:sensor histidine kinase n=1 Tax=Actinoplanes sp. NPDC049265 TaxID=3363902 RepID=UPI00370FE558